MANDTDDKYKHTDLSNWDVSRRNSKGKDNSSRNTQKSFTHHKSITKNKAPNRKSKSFVVPIAVSVIIFGGSLYMVKHFNAADNNKAPDVIEKTIIPVVSDTASEVKSAQEISEETVGYNGDDSLYISNEIKPAE